MSRILNKDFKYVPAAKTDIRKTFKRIRAEQEKKVAVSPVAQLPKRKAA